MGEVPSFDHTAKLLKLVSQSNWRQRRMEFRIRTGNSNNNNNTYWQQFGHRKVVDAVVETLYKTYFKGPYYNWGVTTAKVKDRWWNAFKHEFSWDPFIASLVKKEWQSKCA
ncbi:hypothetical protein RDABS01_035408 [Bienertia sinuspersici]